MTSPDFVVVHTAPSHHEALLLAGLLVSEGIPARVPGSELNDEFGIAARVVGAADVVVPAAHAEAAADIVAAWKDRGAQGQG